MTPDERKMLTDLADKVAQTPAPPRDAEAEDIIRTKIGKRPDALYLMTQTVLIQNLALQRAQQQLEDLQSRGGQGQVSSGSSWLGQQQGGGGQTQYAAPSAPQYAPPQSGFFGGGGGSSFLRGAAQTAAGVAAGTLAAEAIGSMFSHGGGFFGGGGSGFLGEGRPTEEVINNYYDSPGSDRGLGSHDQGSGFLDPGDLDRREGLYGSDQQSSDASYEDTSNYDDANVDDSNFDDGSSGFDDNLV